MCRFYIAGLVLIVLASMAMAEAPDVDWTKTFGGDNADWAYWVEETADSGFVAVGYSYDKDSLDTEEDIYVVRTNRLGNLIWEHTYGGDHSDRAVQVLPTSDYGFMVCGYSASFAEGYDDIRMMKIDSMGGEDWAVSYGLYYTKDITNGFCQLLDDNYLVAGNTADGIYFVKIDENGTILSEATIDDIPQTVEAISATSDGGAIAVTLGAPMALIKVNSSGVRDWAVPYSSGSHGRSVIEMRSGGYAILGWREYSLLDDEFYLVRTDADGVVLWERHYGNQYRDRGYCVRETFDGGLIMTGTMFPPSGNEWEQVWVVRTDANGDTLWTKTIGGTGEDVPYCIQPTSDSGYVIVGGTDSYEDGDQQVYLIKLDPDPALITEVDDAGPTSHPLFSLRQNYPNPFNPLTIIEYSLERRSHVTVSIMNILGQKVKTLVDGEQSPGEKTIFWDGTDDNNLPVASGIYFYKLVSGENVQSRKMILLR